MNITFNGQIFQPKFGQKALRLLNEITVSNDEQSMVMLLYCACLHSLPHFTLEQAQQLLPQIDVDELLHLYKLSNDRTWLNEKYSVAIGEIGLTPSEFDEYTSRELDMLYDGFLQKQEAFINGILFALRNVDNEEIDYISLQTNKGSLEEREQTFKKLNLKGD